MLDHVCARSNGGERKKKRMGHLQVTFLGESHRRVSSRVVISFDRGTMGPIGMVSPGGG